MKYFWSTGNACTGTGNIYFVRGTIAGIDSNLVIVGTGGTIAGIELE